MSNGDHTLLDDSEDGDFEAREAARERLAADIGDDELEDEGFDDDEEPFNDSDSFSDGEALASAGMGTDEDYGGFGGEDY